MNAVVGKSSDIVHSLSYAQNHGKDGSILLANFTDLSATPAEQGADWLATANNYRTQCYTIIVSFTSEETALLRSMPDNGRDKVRTIIGMKNNLNQIARHVNTQKQCDQWAIDALKYIATELSIAKNHSQTIKTMRNPFDNIPSSANAPETPDTKNIAELVSRIEDATRRFEASAKSSEELAGAVFEALLDDDGTMKDFGLACEIRMMLRDEATTRALFHDRLERQLDSIPTAIEATLSEDDRKRLDDNFKSWTDVFSMYLPTFGFIGLVVGICIMCCILVSRSASDTKRDYENRIEQLDRWYEDNADAIAFGQFYRENFPKQYREWQTGRWQQDIAYRDSLPLPP